MRPAEIPSRIQPVPPTAREPNFHLLPFASQMLVWALRKHLCQRSGHAVGTDDVLHVFHLAGWSALYKDLIAIVEILSTVYTREPLILHDIRCPCLAPHESHLLNAVAHLRYGRREEAVLSLCEVLSPQCTRLALPHLAAIATSFADTGLIVAHVRPVL